MSERKKLHPYILLPIFFVLCFSSWGQGPISIRPTVPRPTPRRQKGRTRKPPRTIKLWLPPRKTTLTTASQLLAPRLRLTPRRSAAPSSPTRRTTPKPAAKPPLRVLAQRDPDKVLVARVGAETMTLKSLQRRLALLPRGTFAGPKKEVERLRRAYARRILEDWMETKLLAEEARARGIAVTKEEVDKYIEGTAKDRGLKIPVRDRAKLIGVSVDEFRREMEDAVLGDKLIRQVIRERISDDMIRDTFKNYPMSFWWPARRHVREICYILRGDESPKEISAIRRRMKRIRRRLVWFGAKFEDYLKGKGGPGVVARDLGWIAVGDPINPKRQFIYRTVFKLKPPKQGKPPEYELKNGQFSEVVESPYGFHIFQVIGEQPPRRKTLEEARVDVENTFYNQVRLSLLRELRDKYRPRANIDGLAEETVAAPAGSSVSKEKSTPDAKTGRGASSKKP